MNRGWIRVYALRAAGALVVLTVATVLVGLGVKTWSPGFDLQAVQTVAAHRSAALTRITSGLTTLGSLVLLAPLAALMVTCLLWRKDLQDGIRLATVVAGAALLSVLSKVVVGRPRPPVGHLVHEASSSFPSEHAVQAAAIYLALAMILASTWSASWRRVMIAGAIGLALLVAASRVYVGVHYPTDVVAGLIVGWCWAWLVSDPRSGR